MNVRGRSRYPLCTCKTQSAVFASAENRKVILKNGYKGSFTELLCLLDGNVNKRVFL